MKFSELKGRAVISLEDATKIGEVEDLIVDRDSHNIVSLKVRTGLFQASKLIPVADVKNVGTDAVTISVSDTPAHVAVATPGPTASPDGQQTTAESGAENSPGLVEISSILGNKVVTDAGTMVGELRDVMVDWVDLTITGYEVHEGGVFTKAQEFAASPDVRFGQKLITMPAALLSHPN